MLRLSHFGFVRDEKRLLCFFSCLRDSTTSLTIIWIINELNYFLLLVLFQSTSVRFFTNHLFSSNDMFLCLRHFCLTFLQVEKTSRLDFLWKLQAQKELQDMRELRHYNTQLLKNILPDHVATYFLTSHVRNSEVRIGSLFCDLTINSSLPRWLPCFCGSYPDLCLLLSNVYSICIISLTTVWLCCFQASLTSPTSTLKTWITESSAFDFSTKSSLTLMWYVLNWVINLVGFLVLCDVI